MTRLATGAYRDVVDGRSVLVRLSGLWAVTAWICTLVASVPTDLVAELLTSLGATAVAVAWHRRIILEEGAVGPMAPLNARVMRYILLTVLLTVCVALPVVVVGLVVVPAGGAEGGFPRLPALLLAMAAAIGGLYAAMRFQLVFPGAAVGDPAMTLTGSWKTTAGLGWRLLLGFIVTTVPVTLIAALSIQGLTAIAAGTGSLVLRWAAAFVPIAAAFVQAALLSAFLSFVYLALRRRQEPVPVS